MTDPHHGHHETHAPAALPFSDAQIAEFRKEDVHAGRAVVLLMTCIFMVGVILYLLVALTTWPAGSA